jgi:Flp pilus assembly protein TadG
MLMTPIHTARPQARRRGVAAVEFAVVSSLLFVLVLGIIEFGRAMMVLEMLNNASRNGVRVGVLKGSDNTAVNSAIASALSGAGFPATTNTIQVNSVNADVSTAVAGDAVTVVVQVPYNSVTWLPTSLFLAGRTLGSNVTMRHE